MKVRSTGCGFRVSRVATLLATILAAGLVSAPLGASEAVLREISGWEGSSTGVGRDAFTHVAQMWETRDGREHPVYVFAWGDEREFVCAVLPATRETEPLFRDAFGYREGLSSLEYIQGVVNASKDVIRGITEHVARSTETGIRRFAGTIIESRGQKAGGTWQMEIEFGLSIYDLHIVVRETHPDEHVLGTPLVVVLSSPATVILSQPREGVAPRVLGIWRARPIADSDIFEATVPTEGMSPGRYEIWVNNHILRTVTLQESSDDCTYSVSPDYGAFGAAGEMLSISVETESGCPWTANNPCDWVTVNPVIGTGNSDVRVEVAPNEGSQRSCTLTLAEQPVHIVQDGVCVFTISPTIKSFPPTVSTGIVEVSAPHGCPWTVISPCVWVAVAPSTGLGSGHVRVSVSTNLGAARSCTLELAGQLLRITQQGPDPCLICLERINALTSAECQSCHGFGPVLCNRLVANQPFAVTGACSRRKIRTELEKMPGWGPARSEAFLRCICPELIE